MTDLWTEASRDVEAERRTYALEMAKHASSDTWAFLAQAHDQFEYEDRLTLVQGRLAAIADQTGAPVEDLIKVLDQRFALLREAKDNPFADDSDDDSDDDEKDSKDSDSKDSDKDDDSDDDSDSDSDDDDSDSDDSDDDDSDSDKDDSDSDDDKDGGDQQENFQQFFQPRAARYASLMQRIQAGEDPLSWGGGAPFVSSPARKTAGLDDMVTDSNVPQNTDDTGPSLDLGTNSPMAETTKPRQLPGSTETIGSEEGSFDPALNGGDIGANADTPPDTQREAKIRSIAFDVREHNPALSDKECQEIARQVVARYYKEAEDLSPLLYGDRGGVADGPFTRTVKQYQPSLPGKKPGGEDDGSPSMGPSQPALPGGGDSKPELPKGDDGEAELAGKSPVPSLPPAGEGASVGLGLGEGTADLARLLLL